MVRGLQLVDGPLIDSIELKPSQIAPGHWEPVRMLPEEMVPKKYGFVTFKRLSNGMFMPVIRLCDQEVRLSEDRGGEILGCPGISYQTLLRLRHHGFIRGSAVTPRTTTVSVQSWFDHLENVQDPDFWTPARRKLFAQAIR